jgi:hypothetical protein
MRVILAYSLAPCKRRIAPAARPCYNVSMDRRSSLRSVIPRVSLALLLVGILAGALALLAESLRLDFTPGFGLVQILGSLLGITLVAAAGFLFPAYRRPAGQEPSLLNEIGVRLGLTGLLACYVAGLADMVGVGTHRNPDFERPFLGPLQLTGLVIGATGLILYWLGCRMESREGEEPQE